MGILVTVSPRLHWATGSLTFQHLLSIENPVSHTFVIPSVQWPVGCPSLLLALLCGWKSCWLEESGISVLFLLFLSLLLLAPLGMIAYCSKHPFAAQFSEALFCLLGRWGTISLSLLFLSQTQPINTVGVYLSLPSLFWGVLLSNRWHDLFLETVQFISFCSS